jgi:N-acetylmuramoyl-L-alanine amidase
MTSSVKKYINTYAMPARQINTVYIHCSDSDKLNHNSINVVRRWHLERGWKDVGYHYFITRHGVIQTGRDVETIPAAQKGHNKDSIAICVHGSKHFLPEQFGALRELCWTIKELHGEKSVSFHGHCEVSKKTCPNFDYANVLNLTAKGYMR